MILTLIRTAALVCLGALSVHGAGGCLSATCHPTLGKAASVHRPVLEGACTECHVPVGGGHPATKGVFRPVAQGKELCYQCHYDKEQGKPWVHEPMRKGCGSCHDPHQSGSANLLSRSGPGQCFGCHPDRRGSNSRFHSIISRQGCTACHDPHAGKEKGLLPAAGADLCRLCHGDQEPKVQQVHTPVARGECTACHDPHFSDQPDLLPAVGAALCERCHASPTRGKVRVHEPLAGGQCGPCHRGHGTDETSLLGGRPGPVCARCHGDLRSGSVVHAPVAQGACTGCHDPHASNSSALLRAEGAKLCYSCHGDMAGLEAMAHVHPALKDGCGTCHLPHAAEGAHLLRMQGDALCLGCHQDKTRAAGGPHPHAAMEQGCTSCHDPHGTGEPRMLKGKGPEVCFSCHEALGEKVKNATHGHAPLVLGKCWDCHQPHGSDRALLLTENYPAGLYSPYSPEAYALCLGCHDSGAFEYEITSEATAFRNGFDNLHLVHVNRPDKGRVCGFCHDVHGSTEARLMVRRGAGFGRWNVPLDVRFSENGGTCFVGCHGPKSYNRVKKVYNP